MQQLLIMILPQKQQSVFLRQYKTSCITAFTETLLPKLSITVPMQVKNIWVLQTGMVHPKAKFTNTM